MGKVKKKIPAKPKRGQRFPLLMSDIDRGAIAYLRTKFLFGTMVNAVRYALREQSGMLAQVQAKVDQESSGRETKRQRTRAAILESVSDMLQKKRELDETEPGTKQTSIWINDEENTHIGTIQELYSLERRCEAVRFAVRMQASEEGYAPPSGNW